MAKAFFIITMVNFNNIFIYIMINTIKFRFSSNKEIVIKYHEGPVLYKNNLFNSFLKPYNKHIPLNDAEEYTLVSCGKTNLSLL